jgi:plastocyanin
MSPRRVSGALVAVGVLCALVTSHAAAVTKNVYAGPNAKLPNILSFNDFYRRTITVHQGDSVRWQFRGFHNVAFPARGQKPPPFNAQDSSTPITGVNDAAGQPFWFNGQPRLIVDPRSGLPSAGKTYDGSRLAGSGIPQGDTAKPFTLKFTKRGAFSYVCTVHPHMRGTVRVVGRGVRIPTRLQDLRAAKAQLTAQQRLARRLANPRVPSGRVLGGSDRGKVNLLKFFPSRLTVRAGSAVTFSVPSAQEGHTFTFGPTAYVRDIIRNLVTPVPAAAGPPTLVFNPQAGFPSDPPPTLPPHTPTVHGNGFVNTGIIGADAPARTSSLRFTTPGSYDYFCLLHPEMKATVVVQ